MIEVVKDNHKVVFDTAGVDLANPGLVRGQLLQGRFYEHQFLDYIRSLDLRGVYVDAGAFIGTHTLFFAVLCGADRVYSFEPRPGPRQELERNIDFNDQRSKVTVIDKGLASGSRSVTVRLDRKNVTFDCVSLDSVVEGPVAVIKMDVEGMELDVLEGATRILSESSPVVFAEAHDTKLRDGIEEHLRGFGYVRTGRVFNASPTYEFVKPVDLADARLQLERLVRDLEETGGQHQARVARGLVAAACSSCDSLERRLRAARGSFSFRFGRATRLSMRQMLRNPLLAPRSWYRAFRGDDEVLRRLSETSRS